MAVASTVKLPAQPAAGHVTYIPLGGDGLVAPSSCFDVEVELDSDASGGNAVLTIERDERFDSIVVRAEVVQDSSAVASDFQFELNTGVANISPMIA